MACLSPAITFPCLASSQSSAAMKKVALLLLSCSFAYAAADADPAEGVKNLKTGSDLRIYRKGAMEPIVAKSVDVTEQKLIVVIKKSETAIGKMDIQRI